MSSPVEEVGRPQVGRVVEQFLDETLLRGTQGRVFVCSLPQGGGGSEEHVVTRSAWRVSQFVTRHDQPGRATYFCVSTLRGGWRKKENALEATFAFADVDLKDLDLGADELLRRLDRLAIYPSRVHSSGHGLHLYWCLSEPTEELERLEAVNAKIGAIVAGDPAARHAVTLLRVPGTHNSKGGGWVPVEVVSSEPSRRYALEDLEGWHQDPVVVARGAAPPADDENPFLRAAREQGFRTPVDVDERLTAMHHQGVGDSAVHLTQLSVTASLTAAGWSEDEVVERVLARTVEVAHEAGQEWDWGREEAKVRRMCRDFDRKVVDLGERRARKAASEEPKDEGEEPPSRGRRGKKDRSAHVVIGTGVLDYLGSVDQHLLTRGAEVWRCRSGLWSLMTTGEVRAWLSRLAEVGCRIMKITSNQKLVGEVRDWVLRNPDLNRDDVEWDAHQGIVLRNGLLDPGTLEVRPLRPDDYATACVQAEYDPAADCPHWRGMMGEIFPDDGEVVRVVQELAGAGLLPRRSRSLMKALVLIGPSNCGKSNVLEVLGRLMCDRPNTTPFEQLEGVHGMMDFLRPAPWVLHEAFAQGKWHFSSSTKALLTGDAVNVNVKNGPLVTHVYRSPVFWGTNHPPQFRESSRAMENRMALIHCNQVFDERQPVGEALAALRGGWPSPAEMVLATERPGVLNWALAGMRRVLSRSYLDLTADMRDAAREMADDQNYAVGFFRDAVEFDPTWMVSKADLHAAFSSWWSEEVGARGRGGTPEPEDLGRAIKTMYDGRVVSDRNLLRDSSGVRYYAGIKLNKAGLSFWAAVASFVSDNRNDKKRYSEREADVNHPIPQDWQTRLPVERLRAAHAKWMEK